ncbi:hypothetical protein DSO57_1036648 [Entomophthora muscae]|uniref:Uncharacterized protein n=1 Tax=Entomophthora muscae TaxID=34485 RepID=A0ACC2SC68_9FUNG|nr:hypothetical protein DSO57_1036648 [Entomophthora muscae]
MAISILVSQPRADVPINEHPFDSTEPLDQSSNILEEQGRLNSIDRSWISLPRGFFVNLGVYFSGFILLITLCSTLNLNFAYPPIQFSLYLIYMVYTIYPRFQTRIQSLLNGVWPPTIFKAPNSQFSSFEVPTVLITAPDMMIPDEPEPIDADNSCSAAASNQYRNSFNDHPVPRIIIIQDPDPLESDFKLKLDQLNRPDAPPRSILGQIHPNFRSYHNPPRLTIPEPNSSKVSTEINPIANLKHRNSTQQKQIQVRDISETLIRFGFQDSSGSWGLFRLFQVKFDELMEKDFPQSLPKWIFAILTFPITATFFLSIAPSLGAWTLIDRGTEAWDEVDFNFDIGNNGLEAGTNQFGHTLTTSRALILRQLLAMPEAGVSNFRRFQALTFLGIGVLSTISLGYLTQPVLFGIPGPALGLLVGFIVATLTFCLNYTLPSTAARYRDLLAKYLESFDNEIISPLHLNPPPLPQEEPSFIQASLPRHTNTLHVTLSPEFIEVGDRYSGSEKSSEQRLGGEPGPSHVVGSPQPPSPSIPLHRMPSWATTFDALNGKSSVHSSPILETTSIPSLSPNLRLREFLIKVKPDLRPLDFIFYLDCCVLVLGIVISISYINAVSSLLVELLQVLANLLGLPSALVGMTVLAWGNSISDLVSAVGMAKGGYPMIALTSTLAGPVLNLLLTFGTSLSSLLIQDKAITLPRVPSVTWVGIFFIAVNCVLIASLALPTRLVSGQIRRPGLSFLPYLQLANFFLFLVALIAVQIVFGE